MQIENVELYKPDPEDAGGLDIPAVFMVTFDNGDKLSVPLEPLNRHYQEVAIWYKAQKKKPFKFEF